MRYLKIATNVTDNLQLESVPEEYKFIELISKRYATSNEELKRFFLIGVEAAEKFESETSEKNYHLKVAWIVEQAIKSVWLERQ